MNKRLAKRIATGIIANECLMNDAYLDCQGFTEEEDCAIREAMHILGEELLKRSGFDRFASIDELRKQL